MASIGADNTNILCYGENLMWILDKITSDLGKTKTWTEINKVSLNLSMVFEGMKLKIKLWRTWC